MDDIQKMLRTIINDQRSFRQEVLKRFEQVDKRFDQVDKRFESVDKRFENIENDLDFVKNELFSLKRQLDNAVTELTARIDKLGLQLAYLEDDAPTREEFVKLENRVNKLEHPKTSTFS